MRRYKQIVMVAMLALLSGCATNVPRAVNADSQPQKKLMAAQHWAAIAEDAVGQTRWMLSKKGFDHKTPLYISENKKTVFDFSFRKYLISHFIQAGNIVSTKKEGALEVAFDTQVIMHAQSFNPQKNGYKPGVITAGIASYWILRDVFDGVSTLGLSSAYEGYKALSPGETGVELLLTTSIIHEDQYVMMNANAYYIEKEESWLFAPCRGRNRQYCK